MLCCALFASAVIQFFVQNIRRNEPNQKTKALSLFLVQIWNVSLVDGFAALSSRNAVCFCAEYFVSACVRKYHLVQLKEYHELCSLSLSRVLALDCTISHQMLQFFLFLLLYLKATYTECNVFFFV